MRKATLILLVLMFSYILVGYSPADEPVKEVVLPYNSIVSVTDGNYTFKYNGDLYTAKAEDTIQSNQFKVIFTTKNTYIHNLFLN